MLPQKTDHCVRMLSRHADIRSKTQSILLDSYWLLKFKATFFLGFELLVYLGVLQSVSPTHLLLELSRLQVYSHKRQTYIIQTSAQTLSLTPWWLLFTKAQEMSSQFSQPTCSWDCQGVIWPLWACLGSSSSQVKQLYQKWVGRSQCVSKVGWRSGERSRKA